MALCNSFDVVFSICTLGVSIISIFIAVLTLRQNNRMIEESIRPVVCVYSEYIIVGEGYLYLVIKNFGHSAATIEKFDVECDFTGCYAIKSKKDFLKELEGSLLAPGQCRACVMNYDMVKKTITFKIRYHNGNKHYEDSFRFNPTAAANLPTYVSTGDDNTKQIAQTLQEMLKKNL